MRKCLLFVALLIVSQLNNAQAQSLFYSPDTVCVRQQVKIIDFVPNASSYYWSFCSGNLLNTPIENSTANVVLNNTPYDIEVAKDDGGDYYGFITLSATSELVRVSFGNSLSNTPVFTNLGNPSGTLPKNPASLYLRKDAGNKWYLFVTGGSAAGNSSFARVDLGFSLSNPPNIVNFGDFGGTLKGPRGIVVDSQGGKWYGYAVNSASNELIFFDFGSNISFTPTVTNLGNLGVGVLSGPIDMTLIKDNGLYYLFVVNITNNSLTRIDLGNSLKNPPIGTNLGNISGRFFSPSSISITRDCGSIKAFITNQNPEQYVRVDMGSVTGPYSAITYPGNLGMHVPNGSSRIVRDGDELTAFVVNATTDSLVRFTYSKCTRSSIPSSQAQTPPGYSYDTMGVYNIFFEVNAGLPDMMTACKSIYVDSIHAIKFSPLAGDTTICQRDTIHLIIQSYGAVGYQWNTLYNISDSEAQDVTVWPSHSTAYNVTIPYSNGCVIDTFINVRVSQVMADAGPSRTIKDGAQTVLGGPNTSIGSTYHYQWFPNEFMNNNTFVPNPTVNPNNDITYYLTVTQLNDTFQCKAYDTVVIRIGCDAVELPNAFAPGNNRPGSDKFGLLNKNIVKLNSFIIYDRWGNEVFTTTDVYAQWDGKVNGDPAPLGVYVWVVDGFCYGGQRVTQSGNVTLIR